MADIKHFATYAPLLGVVLGLAFPVVVDTGLYCLEQFMHNIHP